MYFLVSTHAMKEPLAKNDVESVCGNEILIIDCRCRKVLVSIVGSFEQVVDGRNLVLGICNTCCSSSSFIIERLRTSSKFFSNKYCE